MERDMFCEIAIIPDQHLDFTVRVTFDKMTRWENGFADPDEAQRRGIEILLEMSGVALDMEEAA